MTTVFDRLIRVYVTGNSDTARLFGLDAIARALGEGGNLVEVKGFWPRYPEGYEDNLVYSHWTSSTSPEAGVLVERVARALVQTRAALEQEALLVEIWSDTGPRALLVEEGDTPEVLIDLILPLIDEGEALARYFGA